MSKSRSVLCRVTRLLLSAFVLTAALMVLDSCRPQLPKGVIGEGRMERILYDYHMVQSVAENVQPDTGTTETYRYELQQAVFRKHGITEEEFEQSMNFYCSDLQRLHSIYRNLEKRLEREASSLGQTNVRDVYANLSADGDTANVWGGNPIIVVRSNIRENIQTWRQECDSTWQAGDELLWRFMPVNFSSSYSRALTADIIVYFTNDSVRGAVTSGYSGRQVEVRVPNPQGWTPAAVAGHLYLTSAEDREPAVLAATEIMLIRLHTKQTLQPDVPADSVAADSMATDTMPAQMPEVMDERRLSPDEFRRQQPVDQKIDIVKEKPYQQPTQQRGRRRMQQPHLLQRRNK